MRYLVQQNKPIFGYKYPQKNAIFHRIRDGIKTGS